MTKKILQIIILAGIAFFGVKQAQAMVTCDVANTDEACSLLPLEELEKIEIENQEIGERNTISLAPTQDTGAPGVMLIHHSTLTRAPGQGIFISAPKEAYPESPYKNYRSPLSKSGI